MPDARVQAAVDHWAPRFIAMGVDYNDFVRTTARVERWEEWIDAWTATAEEHLELARKGSAGRSAHTVHGGHDKHLRQTVIALLADRGLEEHESPGEATLQVVSGRVRLIAGDDVREAGPGDLVPIPPARHALAADEDSVVLLTVVKRLGHED